MNENYLALQNSLKRHLVAIGVTGVLLVGCVGVWAANTEFSGAVIASGHMVVNSNVKKIQHPTGGIIGELRVREGDKVNAGDALLRLDDTQMRANLAIITKSLDEFAIRQAREEAERDGLEAVSWPMDIVGRLEEVDVAKAISGELRQFEVRRAAREGRRSQLKERIVQLNEEVRGLEAQLSSKTRQVAWIERELIGVNELWNKNLVPYSRVTALEREKERLGGERGQLSASIAQSKGKSTETELQILQIDQELRTEVGRELADIRARSAELIEKKVAAEDVLRRIEMRSPIDGTVFQLGVHTIGGVIGPGETVMLIVPGADVLEMEGRIQPQDIDQVHSDQEAVLRFSALNARTTPEVLGRVSRVSADASEDQKSGSRYYTIRISIPQGEMDKLGRKVVPGMPVDAFISTTPRTVISFLMSPLNDQLARAFRER